MLDATMTGQLKQYLAMLREPIELVASLGDDAKSAQTRELLSEIAALSDKVSASFDGDNARKPSFVIRRASDAEKWVRFAGLPMGHEFTSLVLAMLWAGGHPPKVSDEVLQQIRDLEGDFAFEMYFSLSCHNCPDVVQALTLLALENPRITATLIEGGAFQQEVDERGVMAVPATFLNGEMFASGKMSVEELLAKLDTGAEARTAEKLSEKAPFDVLIVVRRGPPEFHAAHTQFLDHCPRRSRQVHARRSFHPALRRSRGPRDAGAGARFHGSGTRARHHHQGAERHAVLPGVGRRALSAQHDRYPGARGLLL